MGTPVRFKRADLTRAMLASLDAGMKPSECMIDPVTGMIRLVFGDAPPLATGNPLDRLLNR